MKIPTGCLQSAGYASNMRRLPKCGRYLLGAAILASAGAQTRVDLGTQGKNIDFSRVSTKPFRTGTVLPTTCSVGETFFKTDAPAGRNFYGCTTPNVWTPQTSAGLPGGQAGQVLTTDGAQPVWTGIAGDASGAPAALKVTGLQGRGISAATPANGSALAWNGSTNQWEPTPVNITLMGDAGGTMAATIVKGLQGRTISVAAPTDGQTLKWNAGSSQWEPGLPNVTLAGDTMGPAGTTVVRALQGRGISATAPSNAQALIWNGTSNQWEPGSPNTILSGDATVIAGSTVVRGLQGRSVSATAPSNAQALTWNSTSNQWEPGTPGTTLTGDASGPASNTVVTALQGRPVANKSATNGQALTWNGTSNQWEPSMPAITLGGDAQGAAGSAMVTGIQGRSVASTTPASGQALMWNGGTNRWEPTAVGSNIAGDVNGPLANAVVQKLQGRAISAAGPSDGQALTWNGALQQWQPGSVTSTISGDAAGPAGATTVKALQGRAVSANAPADGQSLRWNGAANQWEPGTAGTTLSGDAAGPPSATVVQGLQGRTISITAPADGQALKWNGTLNQWEPATLAGDAAGAFGNTLVKGLQGHAVSAVAPSDGQALEWNAGLNQWTPGSPNVMVAGDGGGTTSSLIVKGLQGRPVAASVPSDGQTLRWNGTLNQWEPAGPAANYSAAFVSQTNFTIAGTAHGYTTPNLLVQCYDMGSSIVIPSSVSVNSSTYDVTIGFRSPQSGRCLVNGGGAGASGGGGSSAVASIFGRTGIITAQAGDYNFSQIAGTAGNNQLPAGIDAGKIGAGTVSSTVFGYLANLRSDVQAQIDGKAPSTHSHTASGDVTGDLNATVVTKIQGQPVAATAATDGQALVWNAAAAQWGPGTIQSGGGGASTLPTLQVAQTSPTVLTIGNGCSTTAPCNVRFGNSVWSIQRSATATISAGTGTAYIYVDLSGAVTVGHNLTVSCWACQAQSGITGFPTDVIPIASWTATNGTWDAQGTDWRASLSSKVLTAGQGMMVLDVGATTTVAVDTAVVPTYLKGSATLDFGSIGNGTCGAEQTISVPGAAPGDAVAPAWPPALLQGLMGTMFVSSTDTVKVRLCNFSGSVADPLPATYSATIIRSF